MPPENIQKPLVSDVFQVVQKKTSAMKLVKDSFNKYASRMLIFMLVPKQSMLSDS